MSIGDVLAEKRVCVCAGAGGVGKTSTSAAIALGMAARGSRVAVITIDPARRLANALGLEELANEPRRVSPRRLSRAGLPIEGELWAMMLDPKRTFDELIERVAPDRERAEQIKANRVYRELSTAVSGSQEFTAIAKIYELEQSGEFDLLVLDTPPTRNALDFLEAPGRISSFLEGRALRAFMRPTGIGMRVLGIGASPLLGAMRRVTGVDLISDLVSFFGLLGGMTEDLDRRAEQVQSLLASPQTGFVLITSAQNEPIEEAIWFRQTLEEGGIPFAAAVVNRVHHDVVGDVPVEEVAAELGELMDAGLARRVAETFAEYHVLARRDMRNVARLEGELGGRPLLLVPHFDDDIHDVAGLMRIHRYLFASPREREDYIRDLVA